MPTQLAEFDDRRIKIDAERRRSFALRNIEKVALSRPQFQYSFALEIVVREEFVDENIVAIPLKIVAIGTSATAQPRLDRVLHYRAFVIVVEHAPRSSRQSKHRATALRFVSATALLLPDVGNRRKREGNRLRQEREDLPLSIRPPAAPGMTGRLPLR